MNTNSVAFFNSNEVEKFPETCAIIIAAWHLSNAENIGKIIRLAHNLGATEALFVRGIQNHRESKIKKTAGFSYDQMNWRFITENDFLQLLEAGYQLTILETCDGARNIYHEKLPQKTILLAGSESHGLPENIIKIAAKSVYIPMPGGCKSLNISNALSVAAFEWYRQQTCD
ncbi:TrmH family RNA methyltransferase [uncultured Draconibacterium sp.]|uniref:TrmH family RNA methyltransferase n=1 Tax=uncultured Draconibacterium sp. TaxID=1573823 RepID=UPI002AA8BDB3|nr:TrmH family RNA methyltransferase [uncultured Draconibacterium sp.]